MVSDIYSWWIDHRLPVYINHKSTIAEWWPKQSQVRGLRKSPEELWRRVRFIREKWWVYHGFTSDYDDVTMFYQVIFFKNMVLKQVNVLNPYVKQSFFRPMVKHQVWPVNMMVFSQTNNGDGPILQGFPWRFPWPWGYPKNTKDGLFHDFHGTSLKINGWWLGVALFHWKPPNRCMCIKSPTLIIFGGICLVSDTMDARSCTSWCTSQMKGDISFCPQR